MSAAVLYICFQPALCKPTSPEVADRLFVRGRKKNKQTKSAVRLLNTPKQGAALLWDTLEKLGNFGPILTDKFSGSFV